MSIMSMLVAGGGGVFTPLSLFAAGEQGAWYDPSDLTTMFQDSAGTMPVGTPGNGSAQPVGKILDKSGRGNHATQSTGSARPTLSALYNTLTNTEDMSAYSGENSTVTSNTTTAPDGTTTADSIYENTTNGGHGRYFAANAGYTFSVALKYGNRQWASLYSYNGNYITYFDLINGAVGNTPAGSNATITSLGNGWYRCSILTQGSYGNSGVNLALANGTLSYVGDPTKFMYAWGMDLRYPNDGIGLPAYQRVVDANTYDSTGFPYYLFGDGANRFMQCDDTNMPTGNLSYFTGTIAYSPNCNQFGYGQGATGKAILPFYPNTSSIAASQYGDAVSVAITDKTRVVCSLNRAASVYSIRAQGGATTASKTMTTATAVYGTNGFGLLRGGAGYTGNYFNGRIYGVIIRGVNSTATEISNAETWMNTKTLAY